MRNERDQGQEAPGAVNPPYEENNGFDNRDQAFNEPPSGSMPNNDFSNQQEEFRRENETYQENFHNEPNNNNRPMQGEQDIDPNYSGYQNPYNHHDPHHGDAHHYHSNDGYGYEQRRGSSYDNRNYGGSTYEVHHTPAGVRRGGGLVIGIILLLLGAGILVYNEMSTMKKAQTLNAAANKAITANATDIVSSNNGKLVHVTGMTKVDTTLEDKQFNVRAKAIKLKRVVEMLQWKEISNTHTITHADGSSTTEKRYDYRKEWSEKNINSSFFKNRRYHNPSSKPYRSRLFLAQNVKLGEYKLTKGVLDKMNAYTPYHNLGSYSGGVSGNTIYLNGIHSNRVGDVRVKYYVIDEGAMTIVAKQNGKSLSSYRMASGENLVLAKKGTLSLDEVFEKAESDNSTTAWIFRGVGGVLVFIGLLLIIRRRG